MMWQIREDSKKGVYVESLKEVEVTNARDVIQQLIQVRNTFKFALECCFSTLAVLTLIYCF